MSVLNQTSQSANTIIVTENSYEIYPIMSHLITCDDFYVTVTPKNKIGFGDNNTLLIQSKGNC